MANPERASPEDTQRRSRWLKWLNIATFVCAVTTNALGSTGKFSGGKGVGDVARDFQTSFTPKSYAFSIWSVIYFGLAVFSIWQAFPQQSANETVFKDMGLLFAASNTLNALWIIVWVQATPACAWIAAAILFALLATVLLAATRAETWSRPRETYAEFFLVDVTLSVYSGWLTVAATVNVAAALAAAGWDGAPWTKTGWSVTMAAVAAVIFLAVIFRRQDGVFGLVYVWAIIAVAMDNKDTDEIVAADAVLAGVVLLASVGMLVYKARAARNRYDQIA